MSPAPKPCHFIGSSLDDLRALPVGIQKDFGVALDVVQQGGTPEIAKVWKGEGPGVLELVENDAAGTYRAVYVVRLAGAVYVLHAFQKKSTQGIKTSKQDVDLVSRRLKAAEAHHAQNYGGINP